jgi:outer membrane protein TolC
MAWSDAGPVIASSTLSLTVRDSIVMALENNRSLSVERYSPEILETFVAEQESVFDPALGGNWTAAESRGQRTSGVGEFTEVMSRSRSTSVTVSKRTPLGLGIDLGASASSRGSNVYAKMFSTRLGATLNLPLLEGLGTDVNLVGVHQAEKDVELSEHELRGFVLALAGQVEDNDWDLLLAREELRIRLASLDLARQQLAETEDRIEVGDVAEIERAAAEGEVALREEAVIDARSALEKTTLQLLRSLNPPAGDFWSLTIDFLDGPAMEDITLGPVESHVRVALETRPDLNQARVQVEKQELELVRTRNGLLPRLDFFITLGRTGYARSFTDSIRGLNENNFDASGGFMFEYAFRNRADRARHRRATLRADEAQAALSNFEQLVELEVRTACVEVERSIQQIAATRAATRLQEAKHRAEVEKFRVGKSTNLLVLVAQRDLIQSQLDEVRAQINRRKALVGLYQAEGVLLDQHRIVMPSEPLP